MQWTGLAVRIKLWCDKFRVFWNRPFIGVTYTGFPNRSILDRLLQKFMGRWGLLVIAVVLLLHPIVRISFGLFHAQRIGHFTIDCELYLIEKKERKYGWPPRIDFFYFYPPYCNEQIVRMYRRIMPNHGWAAALYFCNRRFFGETRATGLYTDGRDKFESRDENRLLCRTPRQIQFTRAEIAMGEREMHRVGIAPDQPFILFHNRDPNYLKSWADWDTTYHGYRDCSIASFIPAMERATRWGYKSLRYGFRMSETIQHDNPDIIDYATNFRSDFLDIWLMDRCRYFIGNTAGPIILAHVMRKPSICTNFIPMQYMHTWNATKDVDLVVPKRLWCKKENRFLTLHETVERNVHGLLLSEEYAEENIEPIESRPEEIMDAMYEMEHRLNRTWVTSDEDEELQRRLWSILGKGPDYQWACRVSADFLRSHPDYLR